jgi:hypothetical protein
MHRAIWSLHRLVVASLFGIASSAFAPASATSSVAELRASGMGAVFIQGAAGGIPCNVGSIILATEPAPGRYLKYDAIVISGLLYPVKGARRLELPAGTYHIGAIHCLVGNTQVEVGDHDGSIVVGNPRQSFAKFTVARGELVNVGKIDVQPVSGPPNFVRVVTGEINPRDMERLHPAPSARPIKRLMTDMAKGQTYKARWVALVRRL